MRMSAIRPVARVLSKELLITALLLLGVSLVVFGILYLSPGNPFGAMREAAAGDEVSALLVGSAGSSGFWLSSYLSWLFRMLSGDFGSSIRTGLPVLREIVRVGINTLYLTAGSLLVTLAIAVPIALYSATRGRNLISWKMTMLTYIISAVPVFWLGYVVIYICLHKFGYFPLSSGFSSQKMSWLNFLLPIIVLGVGNGTTSEVIRFLREEMGRVLADDYIRTARAKGASVWKHSFREGFLIPVTEIIASKIPFILGGAVIVEQVFNWPGMGRMAWQAAQDRDFPVIMGIAILAALFVRAGSLFHNIVYIIVNPRASKE